MKLIVATDPHLVPPGQRLYELDPAANLAAFVDEVNERHSDAAACVLLGDLAHRGDEAAYALLRDILERLQVPWYVLLGNHDNRTAFKRMFPESAIDTDGFVQSCVDTEAGRLLLLDTLETGTHAGGLCEARQDWLAAALAFDPEAPYFLFMHHPPMRVGLPSLDSVRLMQHGRFEQILRPHRHRIRHLFFGHLHRPVSGSWNGLPFTGLRGTAHQCTLDFTGSNLPDGSHEPPAYAIVLVDEHVVTVHTHDFLDRSRSFELAPRPGRDSSFARTAKAAE